MNPSPHLLLLSHIGDMHSGIVISKVTTCKVIRRIPIGVDDDDDDVSMITCLEVMQARN